MASVNKVILVGNLGRDPEARSTQSGQKIVNLTVATSEAWKDQSGERKEKTEWHRVVIMNDRLGDVAEKYLRKGSQVMLRGKLQTRKWTDQSGTEKYSTEIMLGKFGGELVLLDSKNDAPREEPRQAPAQRSVASGRKDAGAWDGEDDAIPF